jgi:hypothetical protein
MKVLHRCCLFILIRTDIVQATAHGLKHGAIARHHDILGVILGDSLSFDIDFELQNQNLQNLKETKMLQ